MQCCLFGVGCIMVPSMPRLRTARAGWARCFP